VVWRQRGVSRGLYIGVVTRARTEPAPSLRAVTSATTESERGKNRVVMWKNKDLDTESASYWIVLIMIAGTW